MLQSETGYASKFELNCTKFQVVLENISKMNENWSSEVVLRGVRWKIHTVKNSNGLGVFLNGSEEDFGLNRSYEVQARIKLVSFNRNIEAIEGRFIHVFHCKSLAFGYTHFISWDNFVNEYVRDDKATIVVQLKVGEPKLRVAGEGISFAELENISENRH